MSVWGRWASGVLPRLQRALGLGFEPWDAPASPADSPLGPRPSVVHQASSRLGVRPEAQQAWLPSLCREDPEQACERLGRWLVADVPGRGPDWAHPSDAGARLLRWGLAATWAELDPDLRRRMAGSAVAHARCLSAQLSVGPRDHRWVLAAAGLSVAGLLFPGLPEARAWWSEGLSALGRALPEQLLSDGSPALGGPAQLAAALEAGFVAAAFAEAAGVALPEGITPSLSRGAWFLRALRGGLPELPAIGGPAPCPLPLALPGTEGAELVAERGWRMLSFREGGWVSAHGKVRGGPSRLVVHTRQVPAPWGHADAGQALWELDDGPVLADPGWLEGRPDLARPAAHGLLLAESPTPLSLQVARVDGRAATVSLEGALGPLLGTRTLRLEGARLLVQDSVEGEGEVEVVSRFPLGPGWSPAPAERGGWEAERGGRLLSVRVDEGPLRWSWEAAELASGASVLPAQVLVGRGRLRGGERLRVRFEIR
ncbi:MAG: heparinase II/III family protein [Alphaproteobacteria bacterium]|nr:heparinase II/III family protein [Alphaproteobacteria bacterium]MCB9794721.1 heparinase II/III family protein [Alphaproteobacteria bacterium]